MSYYSHEGVTSHFQIVVLKAHDLVKAITQLYILSTNQKYKDFRTYRFMQSNENIIVSINQRSIELYINDWFLQYLECLSLNFYQFKRLGNSRGNESLRGINWCLFSLVSHRR